MGRSDEKNETAKEEEVANYPISLAIKDIGCTGVKDTSLEIPAGASSAGINHTASCRVRGEEIGLIQFDSVSSMETFVNREDDSTLIIARGRVVVVATTPAAWGTIQDRVYEHRDG